MKEVCLALAHASQSEVNTPLSPPLDTRTPLHLTAAQGNLAIAQLLIWVSLLHNKYYAKIVTGFVKPQHLWTDLITIK